MAKTAHPKNKQTNQRKEKQKYAQEFTSVLMFLVENEIIQYFSVWKKSWRGHELLFREVENSGFSWAAVRVDFSMTRTYDLSQRCSLPSGVQDGHQTDSASPVFVLEVVDFVRGVWSASETAHKRTSSAGTCVRCCAETKGKEKQKKKRERNQKWQKEMRKKKKKDQH